MLHATHNLRRHIARRATSITAVIRFLDAGDAEVRCAHVPAAVEHEVLGFYVAVDYFVRVEVLEAEDYAA